MIKLLKFDICIYIIYDMNNLRGVDLNLLVVLAVLLEERHVSRAAKQLHMSQPAVSHALARLRELFNDPLLTRGAGGWQTTARARDIAPQLRQLIELSQSVVGLSTFEPTQARRIFRLGMSDYGSTVILPRLAEALRRAAPGADLHIGQYGRDETMQRVRDGLIDAAFGVFPKAEPPLRFLPFFKESFVCVADASHPAFRDELTLERYFACRHISVSTQGEPDGEVEAAVAAIHRKRRIAIVLPHFVSALHLLPGSDLVLTVARKTVDASGVQAAALKCAKPPFPISPFDYGMLIHSRGHADPAVDWLASLASAACGEPI